MNRACFVCLFLCLIAIFSSSQSNPLALLNQSTGFVLPRVSPEGAASILAADSLATGYVTMNSSQPGFGVGKSEFVGAKNNRLAATHITLSSSPNPSTQGQRITFTAVVESSLGVLPDGGTVSFLAGAKLLGTGRLSGGLASLTTSTLEPGATSIKAVYAGDTNFASTTSNTVTQVVHSKPVPASDNDRSKAEPLDAGRRCGTSTTISSSGSPSRITDSVTFTAFAIANDVCRRGQQITCDDGGVAFYDGPTLLGNIPLRNCLAVFQTGSLAAGQHGIRALFVPPGPWHRSSARLVQIVEKQLSSTTLTSSPNPSLFQQDVIFTATALSPLGSATGKIRFVIDGIPIANVPVDENGMATLSRKNLAVGATSILAEYFGDAYNGASSSAPLNQIVNPASTTTAIASSANPSLSGKTVTFRATVTSSTGGRPTGSVTFIAGDITLGTVPLTGIDAAISTNSLPVGSTPITSAYSGSNNWTGSSASLTQTVLP